MRLFHSGHIFGDETNHIANRLFCRFYEEHELFYDHLQHFKLHLHAHYPYVYETHGSLCNLGCFGQENFIGSISSDHHGTRYYGDSITYYYNIDFCIQQRKKKKTIINGPCDRSSILANDYDYMQQIHSSLCVCNNLNSCCLIYRRFIIKNEMFHSLIYNRRKNSVSYFVQYSLANDVIEYRFGIIELFFACNSVNYAVIKYHPIKELYSNYFGSSSYYHLLKKPIDSMYFILQKNHCQLDVVRTDYIQNHCIVVEKEDHFFATTILSYNEHD